MSRIKNDDKNRDKITRSVEPLKRICFGFSYMTGNKHFNFSNVAVGNKIEAYEKLIEKLSEMSAVNIEEAFARGKNLGAEKIPYNQLSDPFKQVCDTTEIVAKDSKVIVFRFCNNKYRLICKDDLNHSNLLYIIGFDFDYSAYQH